MTRTKKTNETSIRVLETLKILSAKSSSIQDIVLHLSQKEQNNKIYTNEVILKYLNTLKVCGFRIVKQKDKYILLNSPVSFKFNDDDLHVLCELNKISSYFPEEEIKNEIRKFTSNLEKRMDDNTRLKSVNVINSELLKLKFNYEKYTNKIKLYEKYCSDGQKLKVVLYPNVANESSFIVEPLEIKYFQSNVYLSVYNPLLAQIQDLNFDSILKVEQLPLKTNANTMPTSVIFKLTDRLAKSYKLHEGERLQDSTQDSIIILNQNEDRAALLSRLMRYGEFCEVLSPKSARNGIKELINKTLAVYN